MSEIYKGYNPIYESFKKELYEQEVKADTSAISGAIYDTFANILMMGSNDEIKTPDGFKKYFADNITSASSIDGVKDQINKKIDEIIQSDKAQENAYTQNKEYISTLFDKLKAAGDTPESLKKLVSDFNVYTDAKIPSLEAMKNSLQQSNESLLSRYLSEQSIGNPDSGKEWEDLSRDLMNIATEFDGQATSTINNKTFSGSQEIQKIAAMAPDFLKRAKDLQVDGSKYALGLRIGKLHLADGSKISAKNYGIKARNLINEILRQKKEFEAIKYRLIPDVPPPPPTAVICPKGYKFDTQSNACIAIAPVTNTGGKPKPDGEGNSDAGGASSSCEFPIPIGSRKCDDVIKLQKKLMGLGSCVADLLNAHGGADGKYGKFTARISNIAYAYIKKTTDFNGRGELTKDIFDTIMGYGDTIQAAAKESIDTRKLIQNKIFEKEYETSTPLISFDAFSKILNEAEVGTDSNATNINIQPKSKSIGDFICQTYKDGKVDNTVTPSPAPDPKKDDGKIPTIDDWSGLKYVNTGSYPVSFDESLLSAWTKEAVITAVSFALPGSGYILKAGSTGLRALGAKGAESVGFKALATKIAGKSFQTAVTKGITEKTASQAMSGLTRQYFMKYGKIAIPKRVAGGLIGGTVGAAALDFISGRNSFVITTVEGFIDRLNIMALTKGMVDTLDGYVSDDDWACISTVLGVIKGAWTIDRDDKAVSAWGELKRLYKESENADLSADIMSVSAKMGTVEGYPNIKSATPLIKVQNVAWGIASSETKDFLGKLDANESAMTANLAKLPKNYIKAHADGNYMEVGEDGKDVSADSGKKEDNGKEGSKSGAKP